MALCRCGDAALALAPRPALPLTRPSRSPCVASAGSGAGRRHQRDEAQDRGPAARLLPPAGLRQRHTGQGARALSSVLSPDTPLRRYLLPIEAFMQAICTIFICPVAYARLDASSFSPYLTYLPLSTGLAGTQPAWTLSCAAPTRHHPPTPIRSRLQVRHMLWFDLSGRCGGLTSRHTNPLLASPQGGAKVARPFSEIMILKVGSPIKSLPPTLFPIYSIYDPQGRAPRSTN